MHLVLEKIIVPCKVFTKKYISNRSEICVSPSKIYIKRLMQKYSPVCFWISDPEAAAASKTAPIFISRTTTSLGDIWREKFFSVKTAARKFFFVKTQQQKTEKMNFAVSVSTILTMLIKTNSKTLLLILIFLAISTDAQKQDFYECVPGIKSPGGKILLWIIIFIFKIHKVLVLNIFFCFFKRIRN